MSSSLTSFGRWAPCAVLVVFLSGCGAGGDGPTSAPADSAPAQAAALSLSGSPASTVVVGSAYSFAPSATAPDSGELSYSIQNKPAWADFASTTGTLSGTPSSADVGTYPNIVISAADSSTTAALTAFSIVVTDVASGSATVTWSIPTTNSDGTSLTNLAGFHVYYGTSAGAMTNRIDVTNSSISRYVIENLSAAKWYFGVKAYTSAGVESSISNIGSKTIS